MTILDWAARNLKALKFSQEEDVTLRPPAEIKGMAGVSEYRLGKKSNCRLTPPAAVSS
ncbi:hypothetical protein [Delftia acidovorans]|uniref:hypothetical protein n=1 Tax=Delftia acidovorans TaxID=80866 RepID=UPI0012D2E3D5|nr:hypothetical protein [Delftia acidovorans]